MTLALKIVSSRWVFPVTGPAVEDGGVVVADGRIVEVGGREEMLGRHPGIPERRFPGILMPGLVNAHIHLELSHLRDIAEPLPHQPFTAWIAGLLARRAPDSTSREDRLAAAGDLLRDQHDSGVVLVADTGNERISEFESPRAKSWPEIRRMLEYLGPDRSGCEAARQAIEGLADHHAATGHAPYSTGPELLQLIKARCRRLRQTFSIHTAESCAELPFLQLRTGVFREFLEGRNRWDDTFSSIRSGCSGTIDYYDRLDLLDDRTVLVHCVHVSSHELRLAAKRGAHICLCPGSNRFLKVGRAPVGRMLEAGLLPALGTDSCASNPIIDLWREMQLLAGDNPELEGAQILAMATLGGARALHAENDYGSLEPGRKSHFLHVSSSALAQCRTAADVLHELISGGRPKEISWVGSKIPLTGNMQ